MHGSLHRVVLWLGSSLVFALVAAVLFSTPSFAQSGGGSSGDGSGCKGVVAGQSVNMWCAVNGAGWYLYSVDSAGPSAGFRDKSITWSYVSQLCRGLGADTVVTYIIRNSKQNTWKSYNFGANGTTNNQSGTGWVSNANAYDRFQNRLGGSGLNWGVNVGWFCYADQSKWDVISYSGVKKAPNTITNVDSGWSGGTISAAPGETVYWKHTLQAGNARIDKRVDWALEGSGFPASFGINNTGYILPASNVTPWQVFARMGQYPGANSSYTVFTVGQAQVGGTLCQNIAWNPISWNVGGWGRSTRACATVPYDYTLTPTINSSISGNMTSGTNIGAVSGNINNSGPTKSRDNTIWQLTRMYVPPSSAIPGDTPGNNGTVNSTAPCATAPLGDVRYNGNFFATGGSDCASLQRGAGSIPVNGVGVNIASFIIDETKPVGTRVCFALSVADRSSGDSRWAHSEPRCITISKNPKVQTLGGDLVVGRGYNTSGAKIISNVVTGTNSLVSNGKTYGSWSQYGIVASGRITGMASAAGFAGGATSGNLCLSLSLLSPANVRAGSTPTCDVAQIGQYSLASASPGQALSGQFVASGGTLSGAVNITNIGKRTVYSGNGSTIQLSASAPLGGGEWIVINAPTSDVRITSNLTYTNASISNVAQLPQLIIIARNIYIVGDGPSAVSRIDGWLVAAGTGSHGAINTCDAIPTGNPTTLNSTRCNARLQVNGPTIANHLYLYRTAGADTGAESGDPAEVFNLRPDAFMWLSNYQVGAGKARTVLSNELPPRY